MKFPRLTVSLIVLSTLVSGCATQYARGPDSSAQNSYGQTVQMEFDRENWGAGPECLMVLPTQTSNISDKTLIDHFQTTLFGGIAAAGYNALPMREIDRALSNQALRKSQVQLAQEMGCPYVVQPALEELSSQYAGFYSEVRASGSLKVAKVGQSKPLITLRHSVSSRDGGVPIGPIGILSSLFSAGENAKDLSVERVLDTLARTLVSRLPTYSGGAGSARRYRSMLSNYQGDIDAWLAELPQTDHSLALRLLLERSSSTHEERIRAFERLPSLDRTDSDHRIVVASHLGQGGLGEAELLAKQLVETFPDNSKNWKLFSDVHAANKHWHKADQSILQAIRRNPSSYELYESLGHYAAMAGENARAKASFQKAIALNPKAAFANLNLAIAAENASEYKTAATRYLLAVEGGLTSERPHVVKAALAGLRELHQATQSNEIEAQLNTAITLSNQPKRTQQ
jgi:tetratricopeptide (TPR) repeat protein/uncharacterized protein YceK